MVLKELVLSNYWNSETNQMCVRDKVGFILSTGRKSDQVLKYVNDDEDPMSNPPFVTKSGVRVHG